MSEILERDDQEALREALVAWYGPQAQQWSVNDAVFNIVLKMAAEMRSCTHVMNYVPNPVNFGNPLKQIAKDALKKFVRELKDNAQIYKACGGRVLINFRSDIELASYGI